MGCWGTEKEKTREGGEYWKGPGLPRKGGANEQQKQDRLVCFDKGHDDSREACSHVGSKDNSRGRQRGKSPLTGRRSQRIRGQIE